MPSWPVWTRTRAMADGDVEGWVERMLVVMVAEAAGNGSELEDPMYVSVELRWGMVKSWRYWRGGVEGDGTREFVEIKSRWSMVYDGSGPESSDVENLCAMWLVREV